MKYLKLKDHYEECFDKYGDTPNGFDWPNVEDLLTRYKVMLDIVEPFKPCSLLDLGCGTAGLYQYILDNKYDFIKYSGLDISEKFVNSAKVKFPDADFYVKNILVDKPFSLTFDYVVANGVFTEKCCLSFEEMFEYFKNMVRTIFDITKKGFAFNVMSSYVDWERQDLFHLPLDMLATFLTKDITRNFIIRNDYGLYEYSVYLFKDIR